MSSTRHRASRAPAFAVEADWTPAAAPAEVLILEAQGEAGASPTLADQWSAFRERCAQLTFFLFDAESWRR